MTTPKMKDADMPLSDRIEAAIKRVTTGYGQMRVPVEATDPDVVLFDCLAELDAARAREEKLRDALTQIAHGGPLEGQRVASPMKMYHAQAVARAALAEGEPLR